MLLCQPCAQRSGPCCCPAVLQMGGCCSTPEDKYESGGQGPAASGGSHRSRHHSSGGSATNKNKTPDFGLGEAYEVPITCQHLCSPHTRLSCHAQGLQPEHSSSGLGWCQQQQ